MDSTKENNNTLTPQVETSSSHPLFGAVPPPRSNVTITTGSGSGSIGPYTINATSDSASSPWLSNTGAGVLRLDGDRADIVINGQSLGQTLFRIEQRLNLLVPNPELEAEWAELKQLGDQYRALEEKLVEQVEIWRRLNAE